MKIVPLTTLAKQFDHRFHPMAIGRVWVVGEKNDNADITSNRSALKPVATHDRSAADPTGLVTRRTVDCFSSPVCYEGVYIVPPLGGPAANWQLSTPWKDWLVLGWQVAGLGGQGFSEHPLVSFGCQRDR
jgi:hypothetical protein